MQMRYKNIDSDLSCVTSPWLSAIRPPEPCFILCHLQIVRQSRRRPARTPLLLFYIQFYDELLLIYLYNDEFMVLQNTESHF